MASSNTHPQSDSGAAAAPLALGVHDQCMEWVRDIMKNVNTVAYIVDTMSKLGRTMSDKDVRCLPSRTVSANRPAASDGSQQPLPAQQAGYMWADTGFARKGEIVLLEDMLKERDDVERALRHELIHAFDDARGDIEPTNCYHQACSEVRAARLSGDCFVGEELKRGRVGTVSGRDCVIRRATLAVENNPLCRGYGARAVEVVLPRCYRDFEPFVAPPYVMGNASGLPY